MGWFIEWNGAGNIEKMVEAALSEFFPNSGRPSVELTEAMVSADLSVYGGESLVRGKPGEVFAEAFRAWQEGSEPRLAAILGSMIDETLRGIG